MIFTNDQNKEFIPNDQITNLFFHAISHDY